MNHSRCRFNFSRATFMVSLKSLHTALKATVKISALSSAGRAAAAAAHEYTTLAHEYSNKRTVAVVQRLWANRAARRDRPAGVVVRESCGFTTFFRTTCEPLPCSLCRWTTPEEHAVRYQFVCVRLECTGKIKVRWNRRTCWQLTLTRLKVRFWNRKVII